MIFLYEMRVSFLKLALGEVLKATLLCTYKIQRTLKKKLEKNSIKNSELDDSCWLLKLLLTWGHFQSLFPFCVTGQPENNTPKKRHRERERGRAEKRTVFICLCDFFTELWVIRVGAEAGAGAEVKGASAGCGLECATVVGFFIFFSCSSFAVQDEWAFEWMDGWLDGWSALIMAAGN